MQSGRVLIVEDEPKLLENLKRVFSAEGFSVFSCSTYEEFEHMLNMPVKRFEIIVLDRLLNGRDSADLIGKIKSELPESRVIIVSALNTASEKAFLLDAGADDYMAKPCDSAELAARVRVLMRRANLRINVGNVVLDVENRTLHVDETEVQLTNREFVLLRSLIQVPGKIYSKTFLYEKVWSISSDVESNVIEATVNKLRRRLKEAGASIQIKNLRGTGYWIEK